MCLRRQDGGRLPPDRDKHCPHRSVESLPLTYLNPSRRSRTAEYVVAQSPHHPPDPKHNKPASRRDEFGREAADLARRYGTTARRVVQGEVVLQSIIGEQQVADNDSWKRIRTASGRAEFEYRGSVHGGIEVRYGEDLLFPARIAAETIRALLAEFASRSGAVVVGTSFSAPPLGSIGDWLHVNRGQNFACYLIPVLADLGYGTYEADRRRFSFHAQGVAARLDAPVARGREAPARPEGFEGGSLAIEAGKMMSRIADEVKQLVLSPVRRIEGSLSEFGSADALRSRLDAAGVPAADEFVLYRFQTEAVAHFHAAFPDRTDRTYRLCRRNALTDDSVTLYVGSSRDFASRLRQHLGLANETTYAMHLSRWVPDALSKVPLTLECWTVEDSARLRPEVLQTLEDYLWMHSQPALGRRGAR